MAVVNLTVNTAKNSARRARSGSGSGGGTTAGNVPGCGESDKVKVHGGRPRAPLASGGASLGAAPSVPCLPAPLAIDPSDMVLEHSKRTSTTRLHHTTGKLANSMITVGTPRVGGDSKPGPARDMAATRRTIAFSGPAVVPVPKSFATVAHPTASSDESPKSFVAHAYHKKHKRAKDPINKEVVQKR